MFTSYRADVITALDAISPEEVRKFHEILFRARFQNANVYTCGNGGSAATASHFANDLIKIGGLRAFSLSDMVPAILAFGNDLGWTQMYANLLRKLLLPQDVVIGISCSGSSPNVVNALKLARDIHLPSVKVLALIGADPECEILKLFPAPDAVVCVPFRNIQVQEDIHMIVCHSISGALNSAVPQTRSILPET